MKDSKTVVNRQMPSHILWVSHMIMHYASQAIKVRDLHECTYTGLICEPVISFRKFQLLNSMIQKWVRNKCQIIKMELNNFYRHHSSLNRLDSFLAVPSSWKRSWLLFCSTFWVTIYSPHFWKTTWVSGYTQMVQNNTKFELELSQDSLSMRVESQSKIWVEQSAGRMGI